MRRIAISFVFLAGLAISYYARGAIGSLRHKDAHSADLAAIEKLHSVDEECTLTQDPKCLCSTADWYCYLFAARTKRAGLRPLSSRSSNLTFQFDLDDFERLHAGAFRKVSKGVHVQD
jgi:hypothetical protein